MTPAVEALRADSRAVLLVPLRGNDQAGPEAAPADAQALVSEQLPEGVIVAAVVRVRDVASSKLAPDCLPADEPARAPVWLHAVAAGAPRLAWAARGLCLPRYCCWYCGHDHDLRQAHVPAAAAFPLVGS